MIGVADADEALMRAGWICDFFSKLDPGLEDRMFSPSFLIPPKQIREENLASWRESFDYDAFAESLRSAAEKEDFEPDAFDPFLASLKLGLESPALDGNPEVFAPILNRVLHIPIFLPQSALSVAEYFPPEFETVPISRSQIPAQIVSDMKSAAALPVIFAVFSVFVIAFLFFRGIRDSLCAMIPVAMALLTVCAVYALCGKPLNLATEIALVLLSGLAIDYGVFVIGSERSATNPYVFRAISASALTTAAGGLTIAFAGHPLLHEAGFALVPGVLAAWGAAALLLPSIRRGFTKKNPVAPLPSKLFS